MSKNRTLNRTLPFGTIHPPHNGAHYQQFGLYFDHAGKENGGTYAKPKDPVSAKLVLEEENATLRAQLEDMIAEKNGEKDAVIKQLEELDIDHDKRFGIEKLKALLPPAE